MTEEEAKRAHMRAGAEWLIRQHAGAMVRPQASEQRLKPVAVAASTHTALTSGVVKVAPVK